MEYTNEQYSIIRHKDDLVVNAGAGAAKTTTLIEYSRVRPAARILYIAFNKAIKEEAKVKFARNGITNVKIETAHSLAYKSFRKLKVKRSNFTISEVREILKIKSQKGNETNEFILAKMIIDALNIYCNNDTNRLDINNLYLIYNKDQVDSRFNYVMDGLKTLLYKMKNFYIPVTHDFYLKQFQMSKPRLPYTHVLCDEGQDLSPAMLDIFRSQVDATKVIVGDSAQAIYGYRLAVNALESFPNFDHLTLRKSFRFDSIIAGQANNVLTWKKPLGTYNGVVRIEGVGGTKAQKTICYLSRTNAGVLQTIIEQVERHKPRFIYLEGGISGYDIFSGGIVNDLLNVRFNKLGRVRDQNLKNLKSLDNILKFAQDVGDVQLESMTKLVLKYGSELRPRIIAIKQLVTEFREEADMIFSTVHKAKGLEYDLVYLSDDFVKLEQIETFAQFYHKQPHKDIFMEKRRRELNEEIHLIYVALTRCMNTFAFCPK